METGNREEIESTQAADFNVTMVRRSDVVDRGQAGGRASKHVQRGSQVPGVMRETNPDVNSSARMRSPERWSQSGGGLERLNSGEKRSIFPE